jgi:hypothetical protein
LELCAIQFEAKLILNRVRRNIRDVQFPVVEVYRQEYRDLADARSSIQQFIEKIYN